MEANFPRFWREPIVWLALILVLAVILAALKGAIQTDVFVVLNRAQKRSS
jgi:hypothetical protein